MALHPNITRERAIDLQDRSENGPQHIGACTSCGLDVPDVAPDANGLPCPHCQANAVCGWLTLHRMVP